jgi:hypothetical protein
LRPKVCFEGANPRTRSSCLLDLAPFHARDRLLRTSHSASPTPCGIVDGFASEVRALASAHPRSAEILPTDFCHPILSSLYLSAPALSSLEHVSGSHRSSSRNSPVHADEFAGAGPVDSSARYSLVDVVSDLRRLTPQSAIPLRALWPLSRTSTGLNHFGHFYERAVTHAFASLTKRRLPLESIRAPASLRKGQALIPFGTVAQPVSNHGYVGGTPPR